MGQFFKFLLASCLGVFLALLALLGIGTMIIAGLVSSAEKAPKIAPNSVLHLTFKQPVPEKTNNIQAFSFNPNDEKILGLQDMIHALRKATSDKNIKGVFLEAPNGVQAGLVTNGTLRTALEDFKKSDKFIIAYGDYYSQGAYYLATTADEIIVNPAGIIDFRGFAAEIAFFKNMLDKIGVKAEVFYAGKFKSATEPFRRTNMSDENRLQVREYLNQIYGVFLQDISRSRNLSTAQLHAIADDYQAFEPANALQLKIVDKLGYREDALSAMREKLGLGKSEKVKLVSIEKYFQSNPPKPDYKIKDKIAIVYAEGSIVDGKAEPGSIGSENYTKILQEVRKDDRVKAVVLRVNSPGGSAMASENIWYELRQIKDAGKAIVVSMGDYAASGGYYISCIADSIVAQTNTLTGSIGVFSLLPIAQGLLNDKLGINFDTVKTGHFGNGISPVFEMDERAKKVLQTHTEKTYELFLQRVAEGRGLSRDQVHEVAQGRVWTGQKAKEIGLVDEIGDLNQALDIAAHLAGLEKFRLTEYPRTKDPFQQLLDSWLNPQEDAATESLIKTRLGDWYAHYRTLKQIHDIKGAQARLPFVISFR